MRLSLNGKWYFRQADKSEVYPSIVPSVNYCDLLANGIIPNPFEKTNEKDVLWVAQKDWLYSKKFEVGADLLAFADIRLVFKRLDTIAKVTLNGKEILRSSNCHIEHSLDVKGVLKEGTNLLEVLFLSPVEYVNSKQSKVKCPNNANGLTGIPHLRKPQCHFGWDWGPNLPCSGIDGDVYIDAANARIDGLNVLQEHCNGKVSIALNVRIRTFNDTKCTCKLSIIAPDGKTLHSFDGTETQYEIVNPILWQTADRVHGKQPLYTVRAALYADNDVYEQSKTIGLRTVKLNRTGDKYGENFQFVLNGEPIFAKGANWIPPDSFDCRVSSQKLEYYVKTAVDSGFNMLRVWGGGYYASDELLRLADEYGLLVWQDFCFACQPYPFFDEEFSATVKEEVEYNVKRIKDHACLALWCGNNEIETMSVAWALKRRFIKWNKQFFYAVLPKLVQYLDKTTPYIVGSPLGSAYLKGVNADKVGDTHLWAVWHGLQPTDYYRQRNTRFCSEFGLESLPDIKCVRSFADEKDFSLDSEVFNAHQKCASGNSKIKYYIASRFRLPRRFEDYIYLSQLCQAECVKDATEHWRRNKGRCNGSLFWQFDDCWPAVSWSSIDYQGNYKALQYQARHFFKAFDVCVRNDKNGCRIVAVNDTLLLQNAVCRVRLLTFGGQILLDESVPFEIDANGAKEIFVVSASKLKTLGNVNNCVFVAELIEDGEVTNQKTVLFGAEKDLKLPHTDVKLDVAVEDGVATYTLQSSQYARAVRLSDSLEGTEPYSDNYFDLLPNERYVVTKRVGDMSAEDVLNGTLVHDVSKIDAKQGKLMDSLTRMTIALKPMNVLNRIFYRLQN